MILGITKESGPRLVFEFLSWLMFYHAGEMIYLRFFYETV
jgi:hypothetical protein